MKLETGQIIIIILLVLCTGLLIRANFAVQAGSEKASAQLNTGGENSKMSSGNPTFDVIMQRKSVRKYTDEKVTDEEVEMLLRAAMAAPTAANKQPWAFVTVTDRKMLNTLAENLPFAKMLSGAQVAIVVCGIPGIGLPEKDREVEYWIQDCSAATQNILLAAESMNLGAVWTGAYPVQARVETIQKLLKIPEDVIPLSVISIGRPTGVEKPKDKWNPERIHREKW